jgi:hypothetical protein
MKGHQLYRLKKTEPFSIRLNEWIVNWFEDKKDVFEFTDIDDFGDYLQAEYLRKIVQYYQDTKKIKVWTGDSELTIFGDKKVNSYFRAWHDLTHIKYNLDFSFESESLVCAAQIAELPDDFNFEKQLIFADVIGQNLYHHKHAKFPDNQRIFVSDFLAFPKDAIYFGHY